MPSPLRVLHLEDSRRDADVIRHTLEAAGVSCDIVLVNTKDGFEAALTQDRFDLILSDYNLPGYDGVSALKYAQQARPDVPVILISGTVGDEEGVRCLHLGATDYLLKDHLERLPSAVERAIQEAEARRTRMLTEAERKLVQEQRERLAALVDASPDFIGYADPKTTQIKYINKGGRKMCGIGENEDIGTLSLGDVHPAWMNQHLAEVVLPAAIRDGLWQGDGAFLHRDGREIPVSMAVLAHRGADGEVDFLYTVSRDITERKQAEHTLRGERDRAQRYLDTADVILLKLDLEGRIVLVNRYGCSLLGWTADELIGRDWIETCLPVRIREEFEGKRRQLLGGDLSIIENPVITKSGEERLVEWRNRLLRDDEGHVIGSFSSGTDITERHRAVDALRTAEERMRFALEAAGVGIWDMDYTSGVLRWSETLEAQYGVQPGTFAGTFEAFLERIHPDDRASVLDTVGKAMQAGADFSVQNRSMWPDGTVRWLDGAGRIYLGAHGEPVRGVGISQDVTERKRAEAEFKRLNGEIQLQRLQVFKATIRTVQDIVNNLLNSFQLVRFEGEDHLPAELLTLVDQMIHEAGVKLKTLADLETVNEKEMAIGLGIDYPGGGS
jgi:PAS domain S-box-containing protein